MELEDFASRLARGLVRAMDRPHGAGQVLLLGEAEDPLADYLRRSIEARGTAVIREPEALPACRGVVLVRLTAQTVCEVWAGVCRSKESGAVLRALLAGKAVWTPQEGGALAQLASNALGARVRERFYELRRAGLIVLPAGEVIRRAAGQETGKRRG